MALNDDEKKGAFGTARALLGRVVERVVGAALGTTVRSPSSGPDLATHRGTEPGLRSQASDTEPVVAVALGANEVRVSWALSDEAFARARRVLGAGGERRARVVVVAEDERDVITERIEERGDVGASGDWTIRNLPRGARCAAAVGVAQGTHFVSAGHARVLVLSASEKAPT
jgi:hypothetical protein